MLSLSEGGGRLAMRPENERSGPPVSPSYDSASAEIELASIDPGYLERVRDEIKFPSVEALREQIGKDVEKAQRYFQLLRILPFQAC